MKMSDDRHGALFVLLIATAIFLIAEQEKSEFLWALSSILFIISIVLFLYKE
jgi:hypothetical protein